MKSVKSILPSLKEKKRYLTFEITSEDKISDFRYVIGGMEQGFIDTLGMLGTAKAGIRMIPERWDQRTQRGIIRVNHRFVNEAKAALIMIRHIGNIPVIIRSLGVSGTLRKARSSC